MNAYSHCLNCQSQQIIPDLALQDAGAYPSGSHKVTVEKSGPARILGKKGSSSLLRAFVCADCGFTALFAEDPEKFSST
jgi:predicted Zn-ribbon and HTH transcriptional regulator